ncbi:MAG: SpoIIE family protein phosphatase [Ruminococcus sp.]|jgi:stage II sporulation protein E|nr:SpoIIE family protein phosphatase [Ruminococcus sp.]
MLKETVKKAPEKGHLPLQNRAVLGETIMAILAAMLLSGTSISGTPIPASAALCGALPPVLSAAALAGGVMGFIIRGDVGAHIADIVAMTAILLFRVIIARVFERDGGVKRRYRIFRLTLTGIVYILSSVVTATIFGLSAPLFAAIIFRGILCSAACAVFIIVINTARKVFTPVFGGEAEKFSPELHGNAFKFTFEEKAALSAVYVLAIIALSAFAPAGINFARVLADFLIIAAASQSVGGGAIIFALSVLGMTLYSPEIGRTGVLLAAGAAISGVFRMYGKLYVTAAYTIITLLFCIMLGLPMGSVYIFAEIFIAALAFMLIPDRFTAPAKFNPLVTDTPSERLNRFSANFGRIIEKIDRAASVLNNQTLNGKNNSIDFAGVFNKICENCPDAPDCIMQNPKHFNRECNIYTEYLRQDGFLTPADLHINGCLNKEIIAKEINKEYNLYKYIQNSGINSGQIEAITIRELEITRKLFESADNRVITAADPQMSGFLTDLLEKDNRKTQINCGFDADNFYHAEIYLSEELDSSTEERIKRILSRKISREFREKPFKQRVRSGYQGSNQGGNQVSNQGGNIKYKYRYIYSEEYNFELSYGISDTPAPEDFSNGYSGDSHGVFEDGFGNVTFIISDGMGSGARAAVESAMTVSLLTELLESGADPVNALKFVNLALEIKSSDETTATADILTLNLYSGKINLHKMGAARTIAAVSGTVREFSGQSLPAGILPDNLPDSFSFRVDKGDKIALFSDGITEESYPRLREMLLTNSISSDSAAKILVENDRNFRADDKTLFFVAVN